MNSFWNHLFFGAVPKSFRRSLPINKYLAVIRVYDWLSTDRSLVWQCLQFRQRLSPQSASARWKLLAKQQRVNPPHIRTYPLAECVDDWTASKSATAPNATRRLFFSVVVLLLRPFFFACFSSSLEAPGSLQSLSLPWRTRRQCLNTRIRGLDSTQRLAAAAPESPLVLMASMAVVSPSFIETFCLVFELSLCCHLVAKRFRAAATGWYRSIPVLSVCGTRPAAGYLRPLRRVAHSVECPARCMPRRVQVW